MTDRRPCPTVWRPGHGCHRPRGHAGACACACFDPTCHKAPPAPTVHVAELDTTTPPTFTGTDYSVDHV